ncbi:MAG: DUF4112 domain-containing protein [Gemmatimonadota bacterium]
MRPATPSAALERIKRFAWLLDNSIPIPGTRLRVGLDPILGLIPGVGDLIGAAFSAWILYQADLLGASRATLFRMSWNVLVEVVVGSIPILGDLFDAGWKANAKNVAILERHLETPRVQRSQDRMFIAILVGGLLAGTAAVAVLGLLLGQWLVKLF